jgi:secondary thiamine-phosphate synthase enzyme
MIEQQALTVRTEGRRTVEITAQIARLVDRSALRQGLCHLFIHHTSASLILCENADPAVRRDLEAFFARLAPDGDPLFTHLAEGPDDMPAHVRSVLTNASLTLPVSDGRLALGTWQGIYLWEHRQQAHQRRLTVSLIG